MKLTALALSGVFALPMAASASDVHSYSGYGCVTEQPGFHRGHGIMANSDLVAHFVACPVVRDHMANDVEKLVVVVVDQSPTEDVSCTLAVRTEDGVEFGSPLTETSSGSQVNTQKLVFGLLAGVDRSHVTLVCNIPAAVNGLESGVVSYRMNEATP